MKGLKPPSMMLREYNNLVRESLIEAAEFWIDNFLPLHFEPSAFQRYGYAARKQKYNEIKRRAKRINTSDFTSVPAPKPPSPLVWSGELKQEVLSHGAGG